MAEVNGPLVIPKDIAEWCVGAYCASGTAFVTSQGRTLRQLSEPVRVQVGASGEPYLYKLPSYTV